MKKWLVQQLKSLYECISFQTIISFLYAANRLYAHISFIYIDIKMCIQDQDLINLNSFTAFKKDIHK